ncbi:class I SAM-dependent methyltransferase [Geofilum sp. OHC36d9]|uniref:class I SAM-dependent methyltransferase n=1 Tax=Geofilum sp. OHC36d9 TaxID=3458413 RepID=UPI004034D36E
MTCPLCNNTEATSFKGLQDILFWQCPHCQLIFKDTAFYPTSEEEKHRYTQHHNSQDEDGYLNFLDKALKPTIPHLGAGAAGLDFGCGPTPVLSSMIQKAGFDCENYDPYFFPELPDERKEFIIATESFEHFFEPARELRLITSLLIPDGVLTIMTQRWDETTDFKTWWYVRDNTHVVFFHKDTFNYICKKYGFSILHDNGDNVIILQKNVVWNN